MKLHSVLQKLGVPAILSTSHLLRIIYACITFYLVAFVLCISVIMFVFTFDLESNFKWKKSLGYQRSASR